jgi:radical SAM superfamily enzyme YgiQ (UPF0313 family)
MNILMVNPRCCYFEEGKAVYKRLSFPIGLMSLSSAIKHIKVSDNNPADWAVSEETRSDRNIHLIDAAAEGFGDTDGSTDRSIMRDKRRVKVFGLTDEEVIARAEGINPEVIFISAMASKHLQDFYEMAELMRKQYPEAIIVAGGIAVSQMDKPLVDANDRGKDITTRREETVAEPHRHGVDIIVEGEAEITATMLIDAIEKYRKDVGDEPSIELFEYVKHIPNLRVGSRNNEDEVKRTEGRVYNTDTDEPMIKPKTGEGQATLSEEELNRLPFPDLSIINPDYYGPERAHYGVAKSKWIELFTTRGCSRECRFCATEKLFGQFRKLSDDRVRELLKYYHDNGYEEVCIEDDSILDDPARAVRIFSMIKEVGFQQFVAIGGLEIRHLLFQSNGDELYLDKAAEFSPDNPDCVMTKEQLEQYRARGQQKGLSEEKINFALDRRFSRLVDGSEIIKSMAENGCYRIYLAVESANKETQSWNGKGIDFPLGQNGESRNRPITEVINDLNKHQIETHGGMMMGNAVTEGIPELMKNVRMCQEMMDRGLTRIALWPYLELPGTQMSTIDNALKGSARMRFDYGNLGHSFDLSNMDSLEHGWTAEELITIVEWANNLFASGEGKNWGHGRNISKEELEKQITIITDPEILYQTTALRLLKEGGSELLDLYHDAIQANPKLKVSRKITAGDGLPEYAIKLQDEELTAEQRNYLLQESRRATEELIAKKTERNSDVYKVSYDERADYARSFMEVVMKTPRIQVIPSEETLINQESSDSISLGEHLEIKKELRQETQIKNPEINSELKRGLL